MKEKYTKPCFNVELFELSQSISSCAGVQAYGGSLGQAMHSDKSTCAFKIGDDLVFLASSSFCFGDTIPDEYADIAEVGGYCYNTPSGNMTVFGS